MICRNNHRWKTTVAWGALLAAMMTAPVGALAEDKPASSSVAAQPDAKKEKPAQKADSGKAGAKGDAAKPAAGAKPEEKKSYYVPTRGYRLEPQPDIPPYVRNLGKTYDQFKGIDWLNVGLDFTRTLRVSPERLPPLDGHGDQPAQLAAQTLPQFSVAVAHARLCRHPGYSRSLPRRRRVPGLARLQQHL